MSRRPAAALALALALPTAAKAEPSVTVLPLGFKVAEFRGPGSQEAKVLPSTDEMRARKLGEAPLVVVWGEAGAAALHLAGTEIRIEPFGAVREDGPRLGEAPRDALPGSRMQTVGPLRVHLTSPTTEYVHGALGPGGEARALAIAERQAVAAGAGAQKVPVERTVLEAGPGAVFEDREPRLVDLDGDGVPEALVVKSYLEKGSALAVAAKREGVWRVVAETPPLGAPRRWLNPAAVVSVGAGGPAIVLVRAPHAEGVLQIWQLEAGKLVLRHEAAGYSNHAFGSPAQELAAAVDLDGDGTAELAIPTLDRAALAFVSLRGGVRELRRVPLPAKAATGVAVLGSGKAAHILVGLEDGRVADVRP